jgi:hypothetical protein
MSALFPTLLWIGLPLVAAPILIHLINLRRQRRIRWAAMQFLLESQRRNRRWILLKQLLLLLARMAAIAVLVFMLAHLSVRNAWLSLLGRGTTQHLILLDDSYSMSDRWGESAAFDEGKRSVQAIVDQAARQSDRQQVTLLTFTEAERLGAGGEPKISRQQITDALRSRLESVLAGVDASESAVGAAAALQAALRIPLSEEDETLIVYLISDFRAREFEEAAQISNLLAELKQRAAQIHLVRCVEDARPNLAITALGPESGLRAAGVEMWMYVTVMNYGDAPARGVAVQLEQDGDALPAAVLDEVPPRDEATHRFRVQFAGSGSHWLSAKLPADAVATDNRRFYACDLPAARPVLIVDGSQDGLGGRQLSLALAPGGATRTGWQPHVERADFLTDSKQMAEQAAVCLLDVPRLAEDQLLALEDYVRQGGGLAFFVGSDIERVYYNERLYRNGEGLFPVPLRLPTQLLDRGGDLTPDVEFLEPEEAGVFKVLAGRRNSFLPLIMVDYYYALPDDWSPPEDGSTRVIARLRNHAPLVVEKKFGDQGGRVVAQLTQLSSGVSPLGTWTNWSLIPAFPVLANELMSYLSSARHNDALDLVGDELVVAFAESQFESALRVMLPSDGPPRPLALQAVPSGGQLIARLPERIASSGVYRAELQQRDGGVLRRDFAFNVAAGEGDLQLARRDELAAQLAGADPVWQAAADMAIGEAQLAGVQLSDSLLTILIVILLAEQLLAYAATFHLRGKPGP